MYRTIFEIGPIGIHSYGLMLTVAFFFGLWYISRRGKIDSLPFEHMLNIAYILIFAGLIGGRLSYVLLHLSDFADDPWSAINPFHGSQYGLQGLNLYGGVILAIISVLIYIRIKKYPLLPVMDLFAPTLALGIGCGRIGCFLNGCCFGTPTTLPWGVVFPPNSIPYMYYGSLPLHPAQLYSSAYGFLLFFILDRILRKKTFDGQVLAVLLMSEAVFRYLIEYVRYYEDQMRFNILGMEPTFNQLISILLFLAGLILYIKLPRRIQRRGLA